MVAKLQDVSPNLREEIIELYTKLNASTEDKKNMASKFNTVNVENIANLHIELSVNRGDQKNLETKLETSSIES